MNNILKIFLSISLSGSIFIVILFLCSKILKNNASRQWQYYIWLIVVARLLLPFAPETNLIKNISQTFNYVYSVDLEQEQFILSNTQQENQENVKFEYSLNSNQPIQDIIILLKNNIWLIWLITAFVLFVRKVTIYQSFVRYVKAGQTPVADTELLDKLSIIGEHAGVKRPVELCINPLISSPLLIGFINPCIVLTNTDISSKDFKYTVLHELTHYKRCDMFYKWLVQITICLHWFNPLVYFMGYEINKACEFSCDESIIKNLDSNSAQEYGKTLLDTMASVGTYKESIAAVTLSENKKLLKERLGAIMNFKRKSKLCLIITAIFTFVLCFVVVVSGSVLIPFAAHKQNNISSINKISNDNSNVSYQTGEIITFGKFNNTPIKWQILQINDKNEALIFSTDVLSNTWLPFDNKSNDWENSYIRSWLNGTQKDEFFSNDNFLQSEKQAVIKTHVSSGILGNATNDFVFLISKDEYYKFDVGNVPYDINYYWSRTGESYSDDTILTDEDDWIKKYFSENELNNYPGSVAMFSSNHQASGSFNASEKSGIRPMMWVDLDALSGNTNNINNQKADIQVNYDNNNIPVSIQSTDSLISSVSGRRYAVYGPFDGGNIDSFTCQLNNDVEARIEIVITGQNKTVEGVDRTNVIGFGKTYTQQMFINKSLLNDNQQFYIFIGSDNIQNLTGSIMFSKK